MNVVQVTWSFSPAAGGSAMALRDIRAAIGGGVISFGESEAEPGDRDFVAVRPRPGLLGRRYAAPDRESMRVAWERLSRANLVICHQLYRYHVQWAARSCRALGIPYWMVLHGALDPAGRSQRALAKGLWLQLVGREALRHASLVVLATRGEQQKAAAWLQGRPQAVLPWPVDRPPPLDRLAARRAVRERLSIPPDAFVLLYLGRLDPIKQPAETIRAAALADRTAGPVHLVLVGPDSQRFDAADCARIAREAGYSRLHLPGAAYGDARWPWLAAADAFITLSRQENFGYALVEALSFGLPAVVSPDIDLAAEPFPGGVILARASAESAASAIRELVGAPPAERASLGAAAAGWAGAAFARDRFEARVRALAGAAPAEAA